MNIDDSTKLAGVIELLLQSASRINQAKPQRYWYPLSLATYGVEEIIEALDSLCSFRTTMWEKTLLFEKNFATYQGSANCVMVNSGSTADLLLCFILTNPAAPLLHQGDEILVPVVTWPTQIWSAKMAGLRIRLVDVNPKTLNIDLADLEKKITPKTRAIFIVHLMGNPCPMDKIIALAKKHNLVILEDCCEALGAEWDGNKVGNFGIGGSFSFFFSHHITTMEGGMISCQDSQIAEQLKIFRAHGWLRNVNSASYECLTKDEIDPRYAFVNWGFNVRPTDVQAGFGLRQLEKLPGFNKRREELTTRFFSFIGHASFLSTPQIDRLARPAWLALPLLINSDAPFSRKEITSYLEENGVETRPIVAGNLAKHPVAKLFREFEEGPYPGADIIHQRGFYIGLSPLISDKTMDHLLDCFQTFFYRY